MIMGETSSLLFLLSGMSATSGKRKEELTEALKAYLSKGKTPTLKYQQLFEDIRGTV